MAGAPVHTPPPAGKPRGIGPWQSPSVTQLADTQRYLKERPKALQFFYITITLSFALIVTTNSTSVWPYITKLAVHFAGTRNPAVIDPVLFSLSLMLNAVSVGFFVLAMRALVHYLSPPTLSTTTPSTTSVTSSNERYLLGLQQQQSPSSFSSPSSSSSSTTTTTTGPSGSAQCRVPIASTFPTSPQSPAGGMSYFRSPTRSPGPRSPSFPFTSPSSSSPSSSSTSTHKSNSSYSTLSPYSDQRRGMPAQDSPTSPSSRGTSTIPLSPSYLPASPSKPSSPFSSSSPSSSSDHDATSLRNRATARKAGQGNRNRRRSTNMSPLHSRLRCDNDFIADEESLRRYLNSQNGPSSPSGGSGTGEAFNHRDATSPSLPSSPSLAGDKMLAAQSYRLAYREERLGKKHEGRGGAVEDKFSYLHTQAAEQLLVHMGIHEEIDEWVERIRKWFVRKIMKPLVQSIEEAEAMGIALHRVNAAAEAAATIVVPRAAAAAAPASTGGFGSFSFSTPAAAAAPKVDPEEVARVEAQKDKLLRLEQYLRVLGNTSRHYLLERIKALADGNCMRKYRWNNGGAWKGKPWSSDFPTDAQIMMHLYSTYMDQELVPDSRVALRKPFTSRYRVVFPHNPESVPNKAEILIHQSHIHPPHFEVVFRKNTLDVIQGRNNLFVCLILFTLIVKTELEGFLGPTDLGASEIDLLRVCER